MFSFSFVSTSGFGFNSLTEGLKMEAGNHAVKVAEVKSARICLVRDWEGEYELLLADMENSVNDQRIRFGRRMTEKKYRDIEELVAEWLTGLMEAKEEEIVAGMQDVVAEAQVEIDGMVADLKAIADYSGALETKIDQLAAAKILEKIGAVCEKCLEDCGEISGCGMCPDDGFYPNLEELYNWGGSEEPEEIAEDIRYEIEFGEKPLGLDREEYQWMLAETYPAYIWEDLKDFAMAQASVATLA